MDDGVRILREAEFWARIWRESSFVFIYDAATSGEKVIKEMQLLLPLLSDKSLEV